MGQFHMSRRRAPMSTGLWSQWHRICGAVWRGGAASEEPQGLVRQKARARRHHVTAAMAVLVRKVEAQLLQQMRCSRARVIAT
jgi:hypothetical protein